MLPKCITTPKFNKLILLMSLDRCYDDTDTNTSSCGHIANVGVLTVVVMVKIEVSLQDLNHYPHRQVVVDCTRCPLQH